jgi:hypothetical protein
VGEQREAWNIPPPKRIDHIDPPDFYKPTSPAMSTDNPTHPDADDKNEKVCSDEEELPSLNQIDTGKEGVSNANDSPEDSSCQVEVGETSALDDTNDDDSIEPVGKEEASKFDQDMMMDDDEEDEKQEPAQETDVKSRIVTTMFQKILSLGGAGHVVVDVGSDMQSGPDHPAQNLGPNARQPTLVHQGRKVREREF